jgi:dolichyl-phosphate-mannose-protein mannosyltransferase
LQIVGTVFGIETGARIKKLAGVSLDKYLSYYMRMALWNGSCIVNRKDSVDSFKSRRRTRGTAKSGAMAGSSRTLRVGVALTLIALAVRLLFVGAVGQRYDIRGYERWVLILGHQMPWEFHSAAGYPPGYFVISFATARLYALLTALGGGPNATLLVAMVKMPPILADIAAGWLIAGIVSMFSPRLALVAGAAWLFNPVGIIDSAYWGQIDSLYWAPAVGAIWLALLARRDDRKTLPRTAWSWIAFGVAVLIKPQAAPVGIALLAAAVFAPRNLLRRSLIGSAIGIAVGACIGWATAALFSGLIAPWSAAAWVVRELAEGTNVLSFTSVNAFNLWAVAMPFYVPDSLRIAGVSLATVGLVLLAVTVVAVVAQFARLRSDRALLEMAALLCLAGFILSTRMHERYVEGAVMLTVALIGCGRRWIAAAIILTCTTTINLLYGLAFSRLFDPADPNKSITTLNLRDFWPLVSHPLSIVNVALLAILLYGYFRDVTADTPPPRAVQATSG